MQDIKKGKSITKELIDLIQDSGVTNQFNITPKEVRIGVFYTGVVLSSGHAGMSYTPRPGDTGSGVLSTITR